MINILIIGFGKVGSHLYYALKNTGNKYNINVIKSSRTKINNNHFLNSNVIFFCMQDDKIKQAVKNISGTGVSIKGKITVHTSGTLSSGELSQLKKRGTYTASFHPVQTFSKKANKDLGHFKKIYIAIEGDKKAVKVLSEVSKSIGSIPFVIDTGFKTLHHICCVLSSNYLVTHLSVLREIYRQKFGFKKVNFFNIYMPLIQQTLTNISASGIESSLTGPIARNDVKTIKKHIQELETFMREEIVDYYRFIGDKTIKIARKKGSLKNNQVKELKKLFKTNNKN